MLKNLVPGNCFYKRTIITCLIIFFLLVVSPSVRFFCVYNLIPLTLSGLPIFVLVKRLGKKAVLPCLLSIILAAFFIHLKHFLAFGVYTGWDSMEYLSYAENFINGNVPSSIISRPPLYPFFVNIIFYFSSNPQWIVIIQHFLAILCIPLIFYLAMRCGFKEDTALIASLFFATNSIIIRMAQFIMSDILFLTLLLSAIAAFFKFIKHQSLLWAVITGIAFSAAAHCRQLAAPFFFLLLITAALILRKKSWKQLTILAAAFFICNMPWSIHNYIRHGYFGISAELGVNTFTKLTSCRLEKKDGKHMESISATYQNVLEDLKLNGYSAPKRPEKTWNINMIPHALTDSLVARHDFTYPEASRKLTLVSLEGFLSHPLKYMYCTAKSFYTLINEHIELYPETGRIIPLVSKLDLPANLRFFLRGMVYISGKTLFAFILMLFCLKNIKPVQLIPAAILVTGYLITSSVQIGFTRYTIPWIPYSAIFSAFLIKSLMVSFVHTENYFRYYGGQYLERKKNAKKTPDNSS